MSFLAQAKYWLDRMGTPVLVASCHEEWASSHRTTLEALLNVGWIRILFLPPLFVYIDHRRPANLPQFVTLKAMIDQAECKIVVEFDGSFLVETTDPTEALKHVVSE